MAKKSKRHKQKPKGALREALQEFSSQGVLDSRGSFTLSPEEATRKLGARQLPTPQSWILVLVQAANRGGASLVEVKQSRSQTTVEIKGLEKWDWEELEPHLAQVTSDSALSAMAVVARALAGADDPHDFSLTSPTGTLIRWKDDRWSRSPASGLLGRSRGSTIVTFSHLSIAGQELGRSERAKLSQSHLTALYLTLARNAMASSVPIRCDGRWLTGCANASPAVERARTRHVALLPLELASAPPVAFPVPSRWNSLGSETSELSLRLRIPASVAPPESGLFETPAIALLYVAFCYSGRGRDATLELDQATSEVRWVKDGLVVGRQALRIPGALGVLVYVNAQGIRTDISGLDLQKGEERTARFVELGKALPAALQELTERAAEGVKVDAQWKPLWTYMASLGALATTFFTAGQALALGLFAAAILGLLGHEQKESLAELDAKLDDELRKLPDKVRAAL